MAEAILNIKHWGNSLGVRLPAAKVADARFAEVSLLNQILQLM